MGIDFAHFGLESGMVFEGTMHLSFQSQMSKKEEKYANSKWVLQNLQRFFNSVYLSNDDMIS